MTNFFQSYFVDDTEITNILEKHRKYEHKQKVDLIDVCQRLEMFLSCSYDGCIKLWSLSKELIIEIKLDETLSHCRFLDSSGDLICGYRNHIFKIVLKRSNYSFFQFFSNNTIKNEYCFISTSYN